MLEQCDSFSLHFDSVLSDPPCHSPMLSMGSVHELPDSLHSLSSCLYTPQDSQLLLDASHSVSVVFLKNLCNFPDERG